MRDAEVGGTTLGGHVLAVLFVDDEAGVREAVRHLMMEEPDIELILAESADAALAVLADRAIDVLVSDQQMPGMKGLELMRAARQVAPDTVRILLSGQVDLSQVTAAFNDGLLARFMVKPWKDEELVGAVRQGLRQRRALTESRDLLAQYERLRQQMDELGRTVRATCLSLRADAGAEKDGEFLRNQLARGGKHD